MGLNSLNRLFASFLGLPAQGLSYDALEKAQLAALRRSLDWARSQSPFYGGRLAGLDISQVQSLQDLAGLPFTSAQDLTHNPQDLLCLSQSRVDRVLTVRSSGSSGPAKRVYFSKAELGDTARFFSCGFDDLLGPKAGVLALLPHDTPDGAGRLLKRALEAAGRPCDLLWPLDDMDAAAERVQAVRPGCVVGLPVHLLHLAQRVGPGVAGAALFCSEYVPESLRQRAQTALGAPAYIHYGSSESGLGGAVECVPGGGCHLRADILWEVVEPGGEHVCPEGRAGELVLSTLRRRAMPLIRYRTGDLARLSRKPCACGGLGPRITWLGGRLQGPRLAGGLILRQAELDEALFALPSIQDFGASLEPGDVLHIDYMAANPPDSLGSDITGALSATPSLARALRQGALGLAPPRRVERLPASHTIKRLILDRRPEPYS